MDHRSYRGEQAGRRLGTAATLMLVAMTILWAAPAFSAGTRELFPSGAPGYRSSIEWRTSTYGGERLLRRTLWKVYAVQGEYILVASSAIGAPGTRGLGDILIYRPGEVTGPVGREAIPATPGFSCLAQRDTAGNGDRGRIGSRQQELAGINAPQGFRPCFYQAPETGIYDVAILGPDGATSDRELTTTGLVEANDEDFGANQATSITAWDISVAPAADSTREVDREGRIFAYYYALLTGGNGRPIYNKVYVATRDGFIYEVSSRGADPYGFVFYSNQKGFLNTDGKPLYRNVMAKATLPEQAQNQLVELQGDVRLAPPEHPLFVEPPSPEVLAHLGIPRQPVVPVIRNLAFAGPDGSSTTTVGAGGTFSFDLVAGSGVFDVIISRDGVSFDPTLPANRVLFGEATAPGQITLAWDGKDNSGEPFPPGNAFKAAIIVQGGEVHFPALDVENNLEGSVVRLTNPPGGICPPFEGGCTSSFYDDRGYKTASGDLVGTAVNGDLCPGNVGNPPRIPFSDPLRGYDSTTNQRGWGFTSGGNPPQLCSPEGGFGDKKGLDRWSYYPSNRLEVPLTIVEATAVTLVALTASHTPAGVLVRWTTGVEIDSQGFSLYRSATGERADATLVTPSRIPARGSRGGGASYSWLDRGAAPETTYTYWLAERERGGLTREYPPIRAIPLAAGPDLQVFLPLLLR